MQYIPFIVTILISLITSYIAMKISITEIKKDLFYLKDKLENELVLKAERELQVKDGFKEMKDDLKNITKSLNDIQINFARMEARYDGKDEVISELKDAVTTILKDKR